MVKQRVAVLLLMVISVLITTVPARAYQAATAPLERLLSQVPDNNVSRTMMWYGSLGELERTLGIEVNSLADLQKLSQAQQIAYLLDVGKQVYYSPFSGAAQPNWKAVFGIEPFAVERELTVGARPEWYAILQGQFASAAITKALQVLSYKPSQLGNATLFSLGGDNAPSPNTTVRRLVAENFNRLLVTDQQVIAAPSTAMIAAATATGTMIGSNAAYLALVRALEGQSILPNTRLLSAVLFDGQYLNGTVLAGNRSGGEPVPCYQTAGLGYRRDAQNRYWIVALVYADANTANQASVNLGAQLGSFASTQQPGRMLFQGWQVDVKTAPAAGNQTHVVVATMQLPQQTDVELIDLVARKDIGFLAAAGC
jgi:hypothetical protein